MSARTDAAATSVDAAADDIADRVSLLAQRHPRRDDFLRALAMDAAEHFGGAVVAIIAGHWDQPMWLVSDDLLAAQIDRTVVTRTLSESNASASSGQIRLAAPAADGSTTARGVHIEMASVPDRVAMLVLYPLDRSVDMTTQLSDLRGLRTYRGVVDRVISQTSIGSAESSTQPDSTTAKSSLLPVQSSVPSMSIDQRRLRHFHRDLDLDATAYRIANESRRMLDCDRVTILVPRPASLLGHRRYRVAAVSGVAVVDRRSNAVRATERMADAAAVMRRPLTFPSVEPLPPQIEDPIDDYLDQNGVGAAALLPLSSPADVVDDESSPLDSASLDASSGDSPPMAILLMERFDGVSVWTDADVGETLRPAEADRRRNALITPQPPDSASRILGPSALVVAEEAAVALNNSMRHTRLWGRSIAAPVGAAIHSSRRWLYVLAAMAALSLIILAAVLQTDHYVTATGVVEPQNRREVFASIDGVVVRIDVEDGQTVTEGQRLMTLDNPDLQSKREVLTGKIATTTQRLASLASARLSATGASSASGEDPSTSMAVEQTQLQSELLDLRAQADLVDEQLDALIVRSPIDGIISTWQLQRRLRNRPVSRGDVLMSVFDPTDDWQLRLEIPTRDAGPVIKNFERSGGALLSTFAIATDAARTHLARVQSLATAARTGVDGRNTVLGIAEIIPRPGDVELTPRQRRLAEPAEPIDPSRLRGDADVTAKIYCGRRSFLASWFDDVVGFYHRNIGFYLR